MYSLMISPPPPTKNSVCASAYLATVLTYVAQNLKQGSAASVSMCCVKSSSVKIRLKRMCKNGLLPPSWVPGTGTRNDITPEGSVRCAFNKTWLIYKHWPDSANIQCGQSDARNVKRKRLVTFFLKRARSIIPHLPILDPRLFAELQECLSSGIHFVSIQSPLKCVFGFLSNSDW